VTATVRAEPADGSAAISVRQRLDPAKSSPPAVLQGRAEAVVWKNGVLLHITAPKLIFQRDILISGEIRNLQYNASNDPPLHRTAIRLHTGRIRERFDS
jgi:hypothetical protein